MAIITYGIADIHSGSNFALVPKHMLKRKLKWDDVPDIWKKGDEGYARQRMEIYNMAIQESLSFYQEFRKILRKLPKADAVFILSDNIEGRQPKDKNPEIITLHTGEQADIAVCVLGEILKAVGYPPVYGVRGTAYHVGETDDAIYRQLPNMKAWDDTLFVEHGGLNWRLQHHVGRSGTPYGKQTPLSRSMIQNTLASCLGKEHDADVQLYGHVHYCVSAGFPMSRKRAFTLPCLKLQGETYGRRFSDFYDVGILMFRQEREGEPVQAIGFKIPVAYAAPTLYKVPKGG